MRVERCSDKIVVHLEGKMEPAMIDGISKDLLALIQENKDIEVNLSEVTYIDSSGLGLLVRLRKRTAEKGRDLILNGPRPQAQRLLELSRLNKAFTIIK